MPTPPTHLSWRDFLVSTTDAADAEVPFVTAIAPVAELSMLVGLAHLLRAAATTPYASQGLSPNAGLAKHADGWQVGAVFGPAVMAAQIMLTRSTDLRDGSVPGDTALYAAQSGATAADQILIDSPIEQGRNIYPPAFSQTKTTAGAGLDGYHESPSAAGDRPAEITPSLNSQVERFWGEDFCGFACRSLQVGDLGTI